MKYLIAFIALIMLMGCAHQPTVETVVKKEVIYVKPSADLMEACTITRFITKEEYLSLAPPFREVRLSEHIIDLTADLKKCNLDKKAIRDYVNGVTKPKKE